MHFHDGNQARNRNYSTENVLKTKYSSKHEENWNQSATLVTCGCEHYRDCSKRALVSVMHPDWLIRSNFRLQVSDNLHKDSHQNS